MTQIKTSLENLKNLLDWQKSMVIDDICKLSEEELQDKANIRNTGKKTKYPTEVQTLDKYL